jgi:hypothetical protein
MKKTGLKWVRRGVMDLSTMSDGSTAHSTVEPLELSNWLDSLWVKPSEIPVHKS